MIVSNRISSTPGISGSRSAPRDLQGGILGGSQCATGGPPLTADTREGSIRPERRKRRRPTGDEIVGDHRKIDAAALPIRASSARSTRLDDSDGPAIPTGPRHTGWGLVFPGNGVQNFVTSAYSGAERHFECRFAGGKHAHHRRHRRSSDRRKSLGPRRSTTCRHSDSPRCAATG